jgi:hypothetical protein
MKRRNPFVLLPLLLLTLAPLYNAVGDVPAFKIVALYGSGVVAGAVLANFIFFLKSKREP